MSFLFINVNHDVGYESSESIPISMGYILATLQFHGWEGAILDDLRDRPLTLNALDKWIRRIDPLVVGFMAYQSTMQRIRFLCRYIRSRHRHVKIVLGGPQTVGMPPEALNDLEDVDVLVRGEGEVVMLDIARALDEGESLEIVQGLVCRCGGRIVDTGRGPEPPEDLDFYASPYLSGLLNLQGKNTAILLSSRGCKHVCLFCITPGICRGKVRHHSIERTVDEMDYLAGNGIERFWFADPNFTEDKERTARLLEAKIERGITTPFWCQTRSDLVDEPLLEKLSRAGADTVAFGLESGSPGILEKTNKRITLEGLRENIRIVQALGMEPELFSIFGLPGETVEDARRTLEFVRSLGIPIQSNSGSQQMQLYFGSVYERNPERYGFKPLDGYRPRYVSIGDDYETSAMTRDEMKKVRNMWALANEQMEHDVYSKRRIFEIMDFLLENRDDLKQEPAFHAYGALTSSTLEEYALLVDFLEGYQRLSAPDSSDVSDLVSALHFFKETDQPSGPTDRIIFDSRSWMDGVPFVGVSGKYWDVLLGRGLILESFEHGLVGAVAGEEKIFHFTFPQDYHQVEIRSKTVEVQATIHKVFTTLHPKTVDEVRALDINNRYMFDDLGVLEENNEILYYLALRDADPRHLLRTPHHFLMLVYRLTKLGKRERIEQLAGMVKGKPPALKALADTVSRAGKCRWALQYYDALSEGTPSVQVRKAQCLLHLERHREALNLIESIPEGADLEFQTTLLECLKKAGSESRRIPSLEHRVLDLQIEAATQRERFTRHMQATAEPVVHGGPGGKLKV